MTTTKKRLKGYDFFAGTESATKIARERGHKIFSFDNDPKFDVDHHGDFLEMTPKDFPWKRVDFIWASPPCTSLSMGSTRHHWTAIASCSTCGKDIIRVKGEKWEHIRQRDQERCGRPKELEDSLTITPKSETGELGLALFEKTLEFIEIFKPRFFIIENPTANARNLDCLKHLERRATSYCRWGKWYRKPTDLWGGFPESLKIHAPCECRTGPNDWGWYKGKKYRVKKGSEITDEHGNVLYGSTYDFDGSEVECLLGGTPCHEKAERGSRNGTQGLSPTEAGMIPRRLTRAVWDAVEREA